LWILFMSASSHVLLLQGLGVGTGCSSHILSLDLPIWVCLSALQGRCSIHHRQHCQWLLCNWHSVDILCCIPWPPFLSSCWWSQEDCNQVNAHNFFLTLQQLSLIYMAQPNLQVPIFLVCLWSLLNSTLSILQLPLHE